MVNVTQKFNFQKMLKLKIGKNLAKKSADKKKTLRLFFIISLVFLVALVILAPAVVQAAETKGPTDQPSPAPAPTTSPAPKTSPSPSPSPGTSPTPAAAAGAGIISKLLSSVGEHVVSAIVTLGGALISLFGKLLILMMEVLVWISMYNNFIDTPYVNKGWVVLRDLVNMFFVLGLLFIAFVTVLKIEKYQWNRLLARLLIMAVLVNFSKTICGIIIDFFQVIMLTFVNAFKDITGANITNALKVQDWLKVEAAGEGISWQQGLLAISGVILGVFYVIIAFVVVVIFCVMLAVRMVALWMLVVLSPLAFFAWTFESGKIAQYSQQWWNEFFNYCIIGPFIAFFLWLSLVTIVQLNYNQMVPSYDPAKREGAKIGDMKGGTMDNVLSILLGVVILVMGLSQAGKMGVAGASLATSAAGKVKSMTVGNLERAATRVGAVAYGAARGAVRAPFRGAGIAVGALGQRAELKGGRLGQIARGARLIGTKEGRVTLGERFRASTLATIGGQPGARVDQRQKEIDNQANMLKRAGADKDPVIAQKFYDRYKNKKDAMGMQAWLGVMGKEGKVTADNFHEAAGIGAFDHYGKVGMTKEGKIDMSRTDNNAKLAIEQQGRQMEKDFEEKNGFRRSFSPFIRDPITNAWLEVKPGEEGEKQKALDSQKSIRTSGVDKMSKALNNAQFANVRDASAMEAFGLLVGVGENESIAKRAGEPGLKNVEARSKEMATILMGPENEREALIEEMAKDKKLEGKDKDKFVKAKKAEFVSVRKNATAEQIQFVQTAYVVSTGKHIQGTGETEIQGKPNEKLAKLFKEKQSEERTPFNLNFGGTPIALSRLDYQKIQQARKEGKPADQLKKMILAEVERVEIGADGKPREDENGKRIKVKIKEAEVNSIVNNQGVLDNVNKIESMMPELLRTTKDKGQIVKNANSLLGAGAGNIINLDFVVEDSMTNSSSILKQEELRKDLTINVTTHINRLSNMAKQPGGASEIDINKITILIENIIHSVEQEAEQTGYSPEYFNLEELKKEVADMNLMKGKDEAAQRKAAENIKKKLAALDLFKEKTTKGKK